MSDIEKSPIEIRLTESEILAATTAATMRQLYALRKGYKHRWGDRERGWLNHLLGCIGETVVAKHLDLFWHHRISKIDAVDVGEYEVRFNNWPNGPMLRINPEDKVERKYILVTGDFPLFYIQGWILAGDAMKDEFRGAPKGADKDSRTFWVPISKLRPMSEL